MTWVLNDLSFFCLVDLCKEVESSTVPFFLRILFLQLDQRLTFLNRCLGGLKNRQSFLVPTLKLQDFLTLQEAKLEVFKGIVSIDNRG